MRLEKVVLDGFKSFADKTEFIFNCPITSIVGPNGCGKSNVVDAVKWVLGDQSVKSLRSDHMADVIFSGSSSRKPLGTAEVTMIFSNTMGKLPIEADEVQISRRIYKSGESEYRINNKECRLKDVRELFMDTGVGVKAYSIIEQGQVEQLVTASKVDRRNIFEEAAGISKYKAYKKEAIRKLERAEQNLLRLADILTEVGKQLRSIKLQAGKARSYLKYTERLKELQLNYSLVEYHKIQNDSNQNQAGMSKSEEDFAAVAAQVAAEDVKLGELGQKIIETENKINHADNMLVTFQSKIEQQMQRIDFLRTRTEELEERKKGAEQRIDKLQGQRKGLSHDLSQYTTQQQQCESRLKERNKQAEELQKEIQTLNSQCAALEADLEDEKSGIIDIVRMTAQLHNELQSISVYRDNLSNQKSRLADRAQTSRVEFEKLLAEKAQHRERLADIEKVLDELEKSLQSKRSEAENLAGEVKTDYKKLTNNRENRSAVNSELAVLKDMELRREGLKSGVKSMLAKASQSADKNKFAYIEGILADIITADMEKVTCVEAALEGKTDTLIINDTKKLLADSETIGALEGRANFLGLDKIEPFADAFDFSEADCVKGRLVEYVNYDNRYAPLVWQLLGKILVVDSIESAIELSRAGAGSYSFVTLSGDFLGSDGTIRLGPLGKSSGLISRRSRLKQLEDAMINISEEVRLLEEQIEKETQSGEHLEKLCKELRTAIYEANTEKMQTSSRLSIIEQNIHRLCEEQPLIAGEIEQLEQQIAQSVQKEYQSKQKLQELEAVNNQRQAHIKELETSFAQSREQQMSLSNKLTDVRVAVGQIAEQNKALIQTISSVNKQLEENNITAETAQKEIQTCQEQIQKSLTEILNCESALSELYVEKEKGQQASRQLHDSVQALLDEQKQSEQEIRQKRSAQAEIEQVISNLKIEKGQLDVKLQNLKDRVQEELGIDIVKSYENYQEKEIDWEAVRAEITELRVKIENLGNVNLDSINEQDELEKRNEFLAGQVEDLNNSKIQLQQLITRLNKQSRDKFRESFEQIRVNFQQIFRKLFGGGKADILLEDSEDILEAGIEIMAQPPGKETRSINLLSGGEKSMTAIALLFSVFKTKPSPFCILDEVDAALDEANNERFNMIIKEFQKESQFIIITHSKRTMSIAELLYGITMQTRGVSKKISVRFEEYEPQETSAAVA
jgi:chromosome segregation protein